MTTKSTTTAAARLLLLPLLLGGALVLWLMTSTSGHAATATQTQALQATVAGKTIAWGSDPTGVCTQDMGTADFGSVVPGASTQSAGFRGCVTSNASGWSVTAAGTAPMSDATCIGCAGAQIPNSAVVVNVTSTSGTGGSSQCTGTTGTVPCSLDVSRTVLSGATSTATSAVSYYYTLGVPANQPAGTYTGGQVTFTASN